MSNYDRKKIRAPLESVDILYCTLGTALLRIQGLINRYGKDAEIHLYTPPRYNKDVLYVFGMREENDDEYESRLVIEQGQQQKDLHQLVWKTPPKNQEDN